MALMTWNAEQYATNVAFIDEENKVLFDLLNDVYALAIDGAERAAIGTALDTLIAHAIKHFAHEEQEMKAAAYADYANHKMQHDLLIGMCSGLQKKFHAGEGEINAMVGQMVKNWLDSHIPTFDKAYGSSLNA